MKIKLKNTFGTEISTPVGFSWSLCCFGCLVPLWRHDFKWFIIMFVLSLLSGGISNFIFPFIYNKIYLKKVLNQGFHAADRQSLLILRHLHLAPSLRNEILQTKIKQRRQNKSNTKKS